MLVFFPNTGFKKVLLNNTARITFIELGTLLSEKTVLITKLE